MLLLFELGASCLEQLLDAFGKLHAFRRGMVTTNQDLQSLSQAKLTNSKRTMLERRADALFRDIASHGVILVHELCAIRTLRANPVEPLNEHILSFMDFLVKQLHELVNNGSFSIHHNVCVMDFLSLHSQRRHDDGHRANVAASILELTEAVDVPTICCAATHCAEIRPRVIAVIASIARPIDVCVVGV